MLLTTVGLAVLISCTTLPDDRSVATATFSPGWDRVENAALRAARDSSVWVPLAGAAAMQIDGWDHKVSHWAVDTTPVFGSIQRAETASSDLEVAVGVGYIASLMATSGSMASDERWSATLRDGLVGLAAIGATSLTTEGLKVVADRTRPNGGYNSFPSGHASYAAVADTLTVRNLQSIHMDDSARTVQIIGADALTIAMGWARVEAGAHYPSDVMVGIAIGDFFGQMFDAAFLGEGLVDRLSVAFEPVPGGGEITWALRF